MSVKHELPPNHPVALNEYSDLPDYSLLVLQKEFEKKDLEILYRRYEQRARIGKIYLSLQNCSRQLRVHSEDLS